MIQIDTGIAVTLALAFLGSLFGFGKMLVSQFEKRMEEKFTAQNDLRVQQIEGLTVKINDESGRISILTKRLNEMVSLLPLQYVRREDWIRFSGTIDQKLDRLAEMFMRFGQGEKK